MPQIWKPVAGFEGRYEVSDDGQVRGLRRKRLLRPFPDNDGYLRVNLSSQGNRRGIHNLVLEAFVGPRSAGTQARHFPDSDRTNNRLDNLSWATPLTNQRDRDIHGTHNKGERNHWAQLDDKAVRAIRAIKDWPHGSLTAAGRKYGVSRTTIRRVRDGKAWEHVK